VDWWRFFAQAKNKGFIMKKLIIMKQFGLLLTTVCMVLCYGCPATPPIEYEYTELLPPGWDDCSAYGINNDGVVIGRGVQEGKIKSFMYHDGEYTEIAPPGWHNVLVEGINDQGVIVGCGQDDSGVLYKSFIYNDGVYTEIAEPDWQVTTAIEINNNGTVVGNRQYFFPYPHTSNEGFMYRDCKCTKIMPPGWVTIFVGDINEKNDIVGSGRKEYYGIKMGFIYHGGLYKELLPEG
jgi:hypothetical protein